MTARKITLNKEELDQKLRFAGYHVMNVYLETARHLQSSTGLDPASLLILATINNASIQRTLRARDGMDIHRGMESIDETHFHSISRRAVAEATGLSRELVRRKINAMIATGLVKEDKDGVKTMNVVANPKVASSVRKMVVTHMNAINLLIAEDIVQ